LPPDRRPRLPGETRSPVFHARIGLDQDRWTLKGRRYSTRDLILLLAEFADRRRDLDRPWESSAVTAEPHLSGTTPFRKVRELLRALCHEQVRMNRVLVPTYCERDDPKGYWGTYGVSWRYEVVYPDAAPDGNSEPEFEHGLPGSFLGHPTPAPQMSILPLFDPDDFRPGLVPSHELLVAAGESGAAATLLSECAPDLAGGVRVRVAPDVTLERALGVLLVLAEAKVTPIVLDLREEALPGGGPPIALDGREVGYSGAAAAATTELETRLWWRWSQRRWGE
jgi:hypothetical protein